MQEDNQKVQKAVALQYDKNNSNSTQKTEQTTTSSADSTQININQKK